MKLKSFIVSFLAATFAFVSCYQLEDENLGTPAIKLSTVEMSFDEAGGEQQLTLTATRDWMVENDADWLVVSPESGAASSDVQTVTVTVLENTGMDRTADVVFTIGMSSKTLTVTQAGPGGSTEALIVYANDFDKVKAEKGEKWSTYLDTFDGWRNETGTGIETVTYASKSLTARTNSGNGSAGKYSDYVQLGASGMNYLWFGTAPTYFAVKDITLPEGKTDYTLSFGAERYLYEAKQNVFDWNEFSVYVSADANKWVKLSFDFAGGALPDGRWDLASTTFTVPAGTTSLNVYFTSSLGSAYAIDDLKLVQADKAGTAIDFAAGDEFEVGGDIPGTGGNQGGGETTVPESKGKKTVEEFIAAADSQNYYELTGKVSGFNPAYCSFDLTDDTGKIYVYSVLDASKSEWKDKITNGGTITIYGKYLYYEQKTQHEVVDAYIVSFEGDGSGSTESGKPESLVKATVAEFLAAAEDDTWYELTGEIISIAKEDYGNFTIKDETGEVYIYGMTSKWVGSNDKSFSQIGLKVGDTVTLGTRRGSYKDQPQGGGNPVPAFYISHIPGEGGGEVVTPPAGEAGEYDPQGVTWTLGEKAYDNTSGNNAQKGTVNGVSVANMLKLGTGSLTGDAVLHVAEGTTKLGFYCVAWKGKTASVKFSVDETEIATITPAANVGATGNPPYASITVTESDYYEVELPSGTTDVKVETLDPANGRVLFIGLKAITE